MIDRKWYSSILKVRSFSGADCDIDQYPVVARVRERLAGSKRGTLKFDVGIFNLRNLSELKIRKKYQIKIANRFVVMENLNNSQDVNKAWKNIKQNIKTSAKESLGRMNCSSITHGLLKNVYDF